jgi:hypothetical protein
MFRALLAHPQEALHKRHLVYCVCVITVGCATIAVLLQSWPMPELVKRPNPWRRKKNKMMMIMIMILHLPMLRACNYIFDFHV